MKKWQTKGGTAVFLLLLMVVAGWVVAPVYYLNDDVTMRSILSGACTGTPDGHAVYMKYPLTVLLAGLYRLTGKLQIFIPWFDLFLAGCILMAGAGILAKCLEVAKGKQVRVQVAAALLGILLFAGLILPHYLYMHYTVVAAILAGAALFLWETGPSKGLPLLLLGLCYLVRSQVFFLALPFLLVAILYEVLMDYRQSPVDVIAAGNMVAGEKKPQAADSRAVEGQGRPQAADSRAAEGQRRPQAADSRAASGQRTESQAAEARRHRIQLCLKKQGIPLLVLAVMVIVFWGIDRIGYGSAEWQSYREYNDSRTELYDYTDFLSTDWYQERYEQLYLSWEQYQVLTHYDTVLDQNIDAQVLDQTVKCIKTLRGDEGKEGHLRQCLGSYYRHIRYDGRPYSLVWAGCYGILLILFASRRRWDKLLLLVALAGGRSLIWVYLIARGRFPERIWLSLYLIEICLLLGMLLREYIENREVLAGSRKRWLSIGVIPLSLALLSLVAAGQLLQISQRVNEQQEKQNQWNLLTESLETREGTLYLMDVFSAVAYAGELYREDSGQILLLGGWLTQSPLVQQRLAAYGASDGALAMQHDQVRLVAAGNQDMTWLEEYLKQRLGEVELGIQESIACGEGTEFMVYQLEN